MIVSGIILFFLGTAYAGPFIPTIPTEIVISKNRHSSDKLINYPTSKNAPFINNFIQEGTNVFFKPQFMLSAQQMPPQVQAMIAQIEKDDCKNLYPMGPIPGLPIVEEPLRIIEKGLYSPVINEVIEINPYPVAVPKAHVIVEEPCEVEHVMVPEAPVRAVYVPKVEIPESIPIVIEDRPTMFIPPAPVLPPFEMPKVPVVVEEVPLVAPVPEVPMVIEIDRRNEIEMPIIPPAPVLPPFEMPEIPTIIEKVPEIPVIVEINNKKVIEIPPAPVLPPMELPKIPVVVAEPCAPVEIIEELELKPMAVPEAPYLPPYIPELVIREDEVIIEKRPVVIPEAPELPPYSPPAFPEVIVEEKFIVDPIPPRIPYEIVEPARQVVIPEAPMLPPFETPKVSVLVEEPTIIPCPPGEEIHEITFKPLVLPPAPVLSPLVSEVIVSQPSPMIVQEKPIVIPQAPELPPFTMPKLPEVIIEKNNIANRVPYMATIEIVEEQAKPIIPEAPLLPPFAPLPMPAPIAPIVVGRPAEVVVAPCPPEEEFIVKKAPEWPVPFAYPEVPLMNPVILPMPPVAPELYLHRNIAKEIPVVVERNPHGIPLSASCVQDIVVERILPKMEMAMRPHVANAPVPAHYVPLGYSVL